MGRYAAKTNSVIRLIIKSDKKLKALRDTDYITFIKELTKRVNIHES